MSPFGYSSFWDISSNPTNLSLASVTASAFTQTTLSASTDLRAPDSGISPGFTGGYQFRSTTSTSGLVGTTGTGNVPVSQKYGVATAGLGIFNGKSVGSGDYGIVNSNYNGNGNSNVASDPLVRDSITIVLSGLSSNFDVNSISNIRFQLGTGLNEPLLASPVPTILIVAPEPGTFGLMLTGLLLPIVSRRSRFGSAKIRLEQVEGPGGDVQE